MKLIAVFMAMLAFTSVIGVGPAGAATHPVPGGTFVDDDGNLHESSIEAIFAAGITVGCVPGFYCPASLVSRAEMAVFLLRAVQQQPADQYHGYFSDVPAGQWYTVSVERLHELGITSGLGDGRYGPDLPVSRAEMAAFLVRAFNLPVAATTGSFVDVPVAEWYAPSVEAVRQAGVTTGCASAPPSFCPDGLVLRDQMASFLARALGLAPIDVLTSGSLVDRPDNLGGNQVHVIYAIPRDGADGHLDEGWVDTATGATHLEGWIAEATYLSQDWLYRASGGTRLRLDTFGQQGLLDVSFLQLPYTAAEIDSVGMESVWNLLAHEVYVAGFSQPNKIYAVWYDGYNSYGVCGVANPGGQSAIMFLGGCPGSLYVNMTMLHEIFHILGAVQDCAPNGIGGGHVPEVEDLMSAYDNDSGNYWLDYGSDDYYGHSNPYCPDVADSFFLDPLPPNPQYPPGWS